MGKTKNTHYAVVFGSYLNQTLCFSNIPTLNHCSGPMGHLLGPYGHKLPLHLHCISMEDIWNSGASRRYCMNLSSKSLDCKKTKLVCAKKTKEILPGCQSFTINSLVNQVAEDSFDDCSRKVIKVGDLELKLPLGQEGQYIYATWSTWTTHYPWFCATRHFNS